MASNSKAEFPSMEEAILQVTNELQAAGTNLSDETVHQLFHQLLEQAINEFSQTTSITYSPTIAKSIISRKEYDKIRAKYSSSAFEATVRQYLSSLLDRYFNEFLERQGKFIAKNGKNFMKKVLYYGMHFKADQLKPTYDFFGYETEYGGVIIIGFGLALIAGVCLHYAYQDIVKK